VLRPGREPNTTEVDLLVEDRLPLHGSLELNNRYSPNTTPLRLNAAIRYDNLWQRDHSIGFQFQVSPEDAQQVQAYLLTYAAPINALTSISAYALKSDSNVAAVGAFEVAGKASIYGLRVNRTLPGSDRYNHLLTGGLDYKDVDENLDSVGAGQIQTPITYAPFALQYIGSGRFWQSGITELSAGVTFTVRGIKSDSAEFQNRRDLANTNFSVFKWDVRHTETLPASLALYGRFDGQLASGPLVSNEQYFAGGVQNVRGYLEASALGDDALHGTFEVRSPSIASSEDGVLKEARAHVFVEGAWLRIQKPLPSQQSNISLASTGVGLRVRAWSFASVGLDFGWPLRDLPSGQVPNLRVHFSVAAEL
jgi:hemolysin activation/secretion protein